MTRIASFSAAVSTLVLVLATAAAMPAGATVVPGHPAGGTVARIGGISGTGSSVPNTGSIGGPGSGVPRLSIGGIGGTGAPQASPASRPF